MWWHSPFSGWGLSMNWVIRVSLSLTVRRGSSPAFWTLLVQCVLFSSRLNLKGLSLNVFVRFKGCSLSKWIYSMLHACSSWFYGRTRHANTWFAGKHPSGPTSLFQAWLLETCQVARAETDLMAPWVSKQVLSDMRSGFGDFPPNDPLFLKKGFQIIQFWGNLSTHGNCHIFGKNRHNLAGMLT